MNEASGVEYQGSCMALGAIVLFFESPLCLHISFSYVFDLVGKISGEKRPKKKEALENKAL